MPNTSDALGLSPALGFWASHAAAMNALYDLFLAGDSSPAPEDAVDPDIMSLWNGPKQADIRAVIEHAQNDARRFLKEATALLVSELGRTDSPIKVMPKLTRDPWTGRAEATPKSEDSRDKPFEINLLVESSPDSKVMLYVSVWRKGGKPMGAAMTSVLRDAYHGVSRPDEAWYPGSAVIGEISFLECINEPTGSLDLDALFACLESVFKKQDNQVLARLVEVGRE